MAGQGAETKWLLFKESSFRDLWTTETQKRVALTEESIETSMGYEDPGIITGVRVKSANISGQEQSTGGLNIVAAPENGFLQCLAALCGGYTTHAGAFYREFKDIITTGLSYPLPNVPVVPGSELIYVRTPPIAPEWSTWTQLTAMVAATPTASEYDINYTTGVITFGTNMDGKELLVLYCKDVADVYSHYLSPSDAYSLGLWSTKGAIDLFEWTGLEFNSGSMEAASSGYLGLNLDALAAKEYIASEDATGHSFPANLRLSGIDVFKFDQAQAYMDFAAEGTISAIKIDINNNLDPYWGLNCDAAILKIFPAIQEVALAMVTVFDELKYYSRFRKGQFMNMELWYGACANGTPIGTTGINYQFYGLFPKFRIESAPLPVSTGKIEIEGAGFANAEEGMDLGYMFVVVNGESSIYG